MTTYVGLKVNDEIIDMDYFVSDYVHRVTAGILESLKDAGQIKTLEMTIAENGDTSTNLNGAPLEMNPFVQKITRSTVFGMVSPLKGVTLPIKTVRLTIKR